jgi:ubiquitin-conjugating enzyme E2 H
MAWRRRIARDIADLTEHGFAVRGDAGDTEVSLSCFQTTVTGPADSPYEGCVFWVRFTIPEEFPFKSPSVGFVSRVLHPNVDEASGSICLDALNDRAAGGRSGGWSPSFTVRHIVEVVLPFLLQYPNPDDPLNRDAAHLMKSNPLGFAVRARAHAQQHAERAQLTAAA